MVATLGVGAGIAVLGAMSSLGMVFLYVGVALFLTLALEPLVQALVRRRAPRGLAVASLAVGTMLLFAFAGAVIVPAVSEQVVDLGVRLFRSLEDVPTQEWFMWLSSAVSDAVDLESLASDAAAFFADPEKLLALGGGVLRLGTGIIDSVTGVIIVSALTVYFVLTLPALKGKMYALVRRDRREQVGDVAESILQSVGRYVGGQLVLALASSIVTFVLTASLGSPAPLVLAMLAFVGALIPVFGPVVASAATVLMMFVHEPASALVTAIVLVVYMQVEAYILTPRVMSRAVRVPGSLVIVAALAGVALGGVLGAFVAVPAAAAAVTIIDQVVIPRQDRHDGRAAGERAPRRT
jgi:predicted PurR-regulated permease PerM